MTPLDIAEATRIASLETMKAEHGQVFTPAPLAARLVSGLRLPTTGTLRVLDLGAGVGALSAALVQHSSTVALELTCVELDGDLIPELGRTLAALNVTIIHGDALELGTGGDFDIVLMNPPFARILTNSHARKMMRDRGVETPNLYAAFVAMGYLNLKPGGQLAALTPRSWTNGRTFREFRAHLLSHLSIDRIETFGTRTQFAQAGVVQETMLLTATRSAAQGDVVWIHDCRARTVTATELVHGDDPQMFIRQPVDGARPDGTGLLELGLHVTTGAVDHRVGTYRVAASAHAHPLLSQANIVNGRVVWPRRGEPFQGFDCPQDLQDRYLTPGGFHVLIKRPTVPEDARRLVAAVHETQDPVAYDNTLHYIECPDRDTAVGLAAWLNTSEADASFRRLSGQRQVNATDIRALPYPTLAELRALGTRLL